MAVAAICAAQPLRSVPVLAAVGEVLGTSAVLVAVMRTRERGTPKVSATIWATLKSGAVGALDAWFSYIGPSSPSSYTLFGPGAIRL